MLWVMATGSDTYVELHAHSAFSFLDGASQPDELAVALAEHGYTHAAVTDHDNLCGAFEFALAARDAGLRPITGAEVTVEDDAGRLCHVTLLARTQEGYANLCRLLTAAHAPRGAAALVAASADDATALARAWLADADAEHERARGARTWRGTRPRRAPTRTRERVPGRPVSQSPLVLGSALRPEPMVTLDQLCEHAGGITLLTGCAARGLLRPHLVAGGRPARAVELVERLQRAFGREHVYVELQLPQQRGDYERCRLLRTVAERARAPVVATGNVHAHTPVRGRLHEVLVAIRLNTTLEACEIERDGNLARVLRSPADMARRFRDHPDAIANTRRIAESIEFDLTCGVGYRYPDVTRGTDRTADEELAAVTIAQLEQRYAGTGSMLHEARDRLDKELAVIRRRELSGFFLLHRDVLELAREVALEVRGDSTVRHLNPPGRGRGSSVESIVCYLTGLSHVDPVATNLKLGRFLNDGDLSVPDIDLDFPRDIRQALLARVVERYGADRCAMVAAHATYRARGAIRDVGRALGLPQAELARAVASTEARNVGSVADAVGRRYAGPRWDAFRTMTREISGLPRVMGQHSGGVVISTDSLSSVVPIQPAATPGRQLVQWDKDSCADAGFLKIDVLGLGMLSAVEECVETIARSRAAQRSTCDFPRGVGEIADPSWVVDGGIDLSRIPVDDPAVFAEITEGDTVGVFQIESRAQIQSLRRVLPTCIDDLVVQVALIRPGPILGQSINPYVHARERLREDPTYEVEYDHDLLRDVLADTHGAIVFQDQVIGVSMALAGFSPGEADGLRRAMTRKRALGSVEAWRPRFLEGAAANDVDEATANLVFDKVIGFCHYGFPRAHSVALALLAYQSAWLRHYYPAHFHVSLLNAQPMGFYPSDSLLRDAARHGVRSLPVDVNRSDALCTVEPVEDEALAARAFGTVRAGASVARGPADWHIRVGLGCIEGLGYDDALLVQREREVGGDFAGLEDLMRRVPLRRDQFEGLVMAGACDCFLEGAGDEGRRSLLWNVGLVSRPDRAQEALDIVAPSGPAFAQLSIWDEVLLDYATQGLSVRAHPVELLRPLLARTVVPIREAVRDVRHGRVVDVVGAVTTRQKPQTAKGVVFLLLEDETDVINVVVNPALYKAERVAIRNEPILRVRGRIERHGKVVNLVAREVHRLPADLRGRAPRRMRGKAWG
jgi:error-prone DNA polymerase